LGGRIEFDEALCDGCGKCADGCCGHCIEMR
jgi:Pyruvate/2-oxoacid:ferredoxin oxidoreductase delta subunit